MSGGQARAGRADAASNPANFFDPEGSTGTEGVQNNPGSPRSHLI